MIYIHIYIHKRACVCLCQYFFIHRFIFHLYVHFPSLGSLFNRVQAFFTYEYTYKFTHTFIRVLAFSLTFTLVHTQIKSSNTLSGKMKKAKNVSVQKFKIFTNI